MIDNEIIEIEGVDGKNILDFDFCVNSTSFRSVGCSRKSLEVFELKISSYICLPNEISIKILGKEYKGFKVSWYKDNYYKTHDNTYNLKLI